MYAVSKYVSLLRSCSRKARLVTIIIIIIHEFHRDSSLETKLQGRYVSRITLQLYAAVADSLQCRMMCGTVTQYTR